MTHASPPRAAGRYELLDRLGSGGMADVFLALAKGPFDAKKLVVLKRPRAASSEYAEMFMDEARLAMRLNHPNVVQTYEVGVDEGGFFLAMEYLEGQPLHRVLQAMVSHDQHLSHAHLARVASDALAGLHYAHELSDYDGTALQIVHRDVSPHNVFVTYEGQIKVVDFGIAKATMNEVHTRTGEVKGKLAYMAPEQATAETVDRRADLFGIGVILWEMIARRRLLTGGNSAELLDRLLTMDFPPLSCEVADVHPVLEAIVMRALQRDPADRFRTALEMREALESYVGMAGHTVRASDIGGLVSGLFAGSRENRANRLREQMQAGAARPFIGSGPASGPAMHTVPTSFVGGPGGDTNGPAVVTPPLARVRGEWRTIASVAVLAVSVVALGGALLVTVGSRDRTSTAAAGSGSGELVGVPVPAVPVAMTTETAPVAASVTAPPPLPSATAVVVAPPRAAPPSFSHAPRRGGPPAPVAPPAPAAPGTAKRPIDTSFPK
jgi:hypothetical protein